MKEQITYKTESGLEFYDKDEALICESIDDIKKQQRELSNKIKSIQETCQHHHMTIQACADTGNYDRSQDEYWFNADCRACGKNWRVDQSEQSLVRERNRSNDPRVIIKK